MSEQEGQIGSRLPDSTDAAQQNIEAIAVGLESKFATQGAQPFNGFGRPGPGNMGDELCAQQDEDEEPPHPFERLHAHIFDIQSLFLLKTITMFHLST